MQIGTEGFRLEGLFHQEGGNHRVLCIAKNLAKKEFSLDGALYERFSTHIGKFPSVMIAPDDVQIISGGSEERRRFLDALYSQLDPLYLQNLIEYNKIIQQRNGFLKAMAEKGTANHHLLDVYDQQLEGPGNYIFERRTVFLQELLPMVLSYYQGIAGSSEPMALSYESPLQQASFQSLLKACRNKDMIYQRTLTGIHKDDILIRFNDQLFKQFASQGQRKSLLFALKFAEFETLKRAKGFAPILLLDDVFEKLDGSRMRNLLHWICVENAGQIFITDTHGERIESELRALSTNVQLIGL